jgi:hypothetical protein
MDHSPPILDEEILTETLSGVTDMHDLICDANAPDWLETLSGHLGLTAGQRRCMTLLLIGTKAQQIHERAISLLADQLSTTPDLDQFVGGLLSDNDPQLPN